ncbi:MAG: MMPL family transporter [Solirubrobacteraceae bacterium]
MTRLLAIPSGRRAKWVVLAVWLIAVFGSIAANLPGKFSDAERNESTSFLPGDAESTKALEQTKKLQGAELAPMVVVYRRDAGLTAADRARIARDRTTLNALALKNTTPFSPPQVAQDRTAALLIANIRAGDGKSETILDPVDAVRGKVSGEAGGLSVRVTGGAGFSADAIKVFENINGTLLLSAVALVFVLLALIYRSPLFLWIPLTAVAFAELMSRSIGWGLTEAGVTVNGQSSSILSILVLGAGTDYALLLVARYREELRRHDDKHEAMALALRTAGPAIFASGITVMLALLSLSIAEVNGTAGLGPIGALGIFIAMVSMLTLLPALLVIFGRGAFWPRVPHVGDAGADATHGAWRRMGERIATAPRRVWVGAGLLLLVLSLGVLNFSTGLTQGSSFRGSVESVEGQKLLAKSFPSGANGPTDVFVPDVSKAAAVAQAVGRVDGVAGVRPTTRGDRAVLLSAVLKPDPYSTEAYALVPKVRAAAKQAGGPGVLVGGPTAVEKDLRDAAGRDTRTIIPITLLVVLLVLIVLLRSLVAPLVLMGTVILSFFASLGVGAVVFDVVFGFPGSDPSMPLFAFVFLVALGIDYNIFLMARVREETARHGTRDGMVRGLAVTGGVITSAGIVLAGTFSVLAVLPLVFLTELGFVIAFGVLLDTFLVRSVLVPALVLDIGDRVWWPSRWARRAAADRPGAVAPSEA